MTAVPLSDRYRVQSQLGSGGMGVVYAAHDVALDRVVALKLLNPTLSRDAEFRARFLREAALLARLDSPHVVHIYDVGEMDAGLFMATQLIEGGDLQALVRARGVMPVDLVLDLVVQLCDGLDHAHEAGVVHRDIKPSNVLVRHRHGRPTVFLCDFGIAATTDAAMTRSGSVIGSPAYMAPERHYGAQPEVAGDVYSLGCLVWTLLTGRPPFSGTEYEVARQHVRAPRPQLPGASALVRDLNALLARSMAIAPEARHLSARDLGQELELLRDRYRRESLAVVVAPPPTFDEGSPPPESVTMFGERTTIHARPPRDVVDLGRQETLARTPPAPPAARPGPAGAPPSPAPVKAGPTFTHRETAAVEKAIARARVATGVSISIFVGESTPPARDFAVGLHSSLLSPDDGLLIMIDPLARLFEVVTGAQVRSRLDDRAVGAVVLEMQHLFASGQMGEGLRHGVSALAQRLAGASSS